MRQSFSTHGLGLTRGPYSAATPRPASTPAASIRSRTFQALRSNPFGHASARLLRSTRAKRQPVHVVIDANWPYIGAMSMLADTVIAKLSADERLALIEALWDSLSDAETPLTDAQRAELDRRLASFDGDKNGAIAWDSIKAELRLRR